MINIRECQILQETLDRLDFRIVRGSRYTEADERLLRSEARKRLGRDIRIEMSYVDSLERTQSGKLRFVLSKLPRNQIDKTSLSRSE
jgi:phenylacetate-CoA ligase